MNDSDLAQRYRWFCLVGWKHPTLNDPLVIRGDATPEHIDHLIQEGMKRWPLKPISTLPPRESA